MLISIYFPSLLPSVQSCVEVGEDPRRRLGSGPGEGESKVDINVSQIGEQDQQQQQQQREQEHHHHHQQSPSDQRMTSGMDFGRSPDHHSELK